MIATIVIAIALVILLVVGSSIRMVQQYERGIVLRFGRLLPQIREPGLRLLVPFADRMRKVNMQTVVLGVPPQGAITRDNVTLTVDAVVYYKVIDPIKAIINVEHYPTAVSQVAQTSLRSIIGRADLDTLLSDREQINAELRAVIDTPTQGPWGLHIERVEIKDVALPEGMKRSMSRQAEAERERRARVIAADGEFEASAKLAQAADAMSATPGALQLRLLQTMVDVASEKNNTLVMPFPVEMLRFFEREPLTRDEPARSGGSSGPGPDAAPGLPRDHRVALEPAGELVAAPAIEPAAPADGVPDDAARTAPVDTAAPATGGRANGVPNPA